MNKFEMNLSFLKRFDWIDCSVVENADDSSIEIVLNKNKEAVPRVVSGGNKLFLHSKFAPEKEADRFVSDVEFENYNLFIVFGFGFAYHIERILKLAPKNSHVLVIEKSFELLKAALKNRNLENILMDERLLLLVDPSEDDIAEVMQGKSSFKITFLMHPGSHRAWPDYYNNVSNITKSYLSSKEANIATLAKFEKLWSSNIAANIVNMIENPGVSIFYNKFQGHNALVVGAGPSLTNSIEFIRKNRNHFIVIAVDTAFYLLKKHGIDPHFCITADPQIINARYFENNNDSTAVIVADPVSHPSIFRFYNGPISVTSPPFETFKWIEDFTGEKGEVTHGGSVSTNAADFANRLGVENVYLIGQDLSFTGGYAHAKGSYLDEQIHNVTNRYKNEQCFNRIQMTALPKIMVKGIKSETVHTNQKMVIFLNWFENKPKYGLVNLTDDGAYIKNVEHLDKDKITFNVEVDFDKLIQNIYDNHYNNVSHDKVLNKEKILKKIELMINEVDALNERLLTASVVSEELFEKIKNRSSDKQRIGILVDKLDRIDEYIKSRTGVKDMIGLTVQKVIHTITEGYDIPDADENLSEDAESVRRSVFFYKGMKDGVDFNCKVLLRMKNILIRSDI